MTTILNNIYKFSSGTVESTQERHDLDGLVDIHQNPLRATSHVEDQNDLILFEAKKKSNTINDFSTSKYLLNRMSGHLLDDILAEIPVAVAGGSILRALTMDATKITQIETDEHDIDLWFYTTDVVSTIENILTCWSARRVHEIYVENGQWKDGKLTLTAVQHVLKVSVVTRYGKRGHQRVKFDMILKAFPSIKDFLTGFDLDCCRHSFDGHRFLSTSCGVNALTTSTNIYDLRDRRLFSSARLAGRIIKYAIKGYATAIRNYPEAATLRSDVEAGKLSANDWDTMKNTLIRVIEIEIQYGQQDSALETKARHLKEEEYYVLASALETPVT